MFTATCANCGSPHELDETKIPVSGVVMKCPVCTKAMIVMPPRQGEPAGDTTPVVGNATPPLSIPPPLPVGPRATASLSKSPFADETDLLTPKRSSSPEDLIDLPAPRAPAGGRPGTPMVTDLPDLLVPVGPHPTRGIGENDLPDLVVPVGPTGRRDAPDLLEPVGPTPRRGVTPDLLEPVGPTSRRYAPDLLEPVGPASRRNAPDLLEPVGPASRRNAPDLLEPVGPASRRNAPDLLEPVGPASRRNAPDLLEPVGPASRRNAPDLLEPVGPTPRRNAPDLLEPVGPVAKRNAPDLLEPVGPVAKRNAPDLLEPVGPVAKRNVPDLLEPVGPVAKRNAPDLLEPVGSVPSKNLPAPKGFFDDIPAPRMGSAPPARASSSPPPLPLDDDLDVVPAGQARPPMPPPPPVRPPPPPPGMPSLPAPEAKKSGPSLPPINPEPARPPLGFGEVDLPTPNPDGEAVVSFSKPGTRPAAAASGPPAQKASTTELPDLPSLAELPKRAGTVAPDTAATAAKARAQAAEKAEKSKARKARARRLLTAATIGVALLGGGLYVYTSVELTVFGIMTIPAKDRRDSIVNGLAAARKQLRSDENNHWDLAVSAAKKVALLDGRNLEALALAAQAEAAAAIDDGLKEDARKKAADEMLADVITKNLRGPEVEKAQALRSVLDPGKAAEAATVLARVSKARPADADAALFLGWADLEARQFGEAKAAFEKSLALSRDRLPALYGLARALLAVGETAKAKEIFEKVIAKRPGHKHFGAWLGIIESETPVRDRTGKRERELASLCEQAQEQENGHPRDRARAWTLYADEAMAAGRFDQAAERYRTAKKLDARNLDALVGGALAVIAGQGDSEARGNPNIADARGDLEAALKLNPAQIEALIGLTHIALLEARALDARKSIEQAVQLDEKNPEPHYLLGRVLEDAAIADTAGAEKEYRRAIELAPARYDAYVALSHLVATEKGRAKEALEILAPVAAAAKADSSLANTLGTAYLGAQDAVAAETWFRTALEVNKDNIEARTNLGEALEVQGKIQPALTEYQAAFRAAPKREETALRLAAAYERAHSYAAADTLFEGLLFTASGNVPTVRVRATAGRYYARRGKIALAQKQGELIAASDPNHPVVHFARGLGLLAERKLDDAQRELTVAIQTDPQAQYWEALARVAEVRGVITDAQSAFEQSARIDPSYGPPHAGLGRLHMSRRAFGAALGELEKAQHLDPEAPDAADTIARIGDCDFEVGDFSKAVEAYQASLARQASPETQFKIGRAFTRLDKPAEALGKLREAVAKAPVDATWLPDAYLLLADAYRATGQTGERCAALRKYVDTTPSTDPVRAQIKRQLVGCP